jgi:predicted phosphohydrolase
MGVGISPTGITLRVVCISDTHCISHPKDLPDGDILIHAGDLSLIGEIHEIQHALGWLRRFPHKWKFFIGGNHDNALVNFGVEPFREQLSPYKDRTPIRYLNGLYRIPEFTLFGSASQPVKSVYRHGARAFMVEHGPDARFWGLAPHCDILVSHCPPMGILDLDDYGAASIRTYVNSVKPKLHVFGHVHEGYGTQYNGETQFVNAALLDGQYKPTHEPTVVEI